MNVGLPAYFELTFKTTGRIIQTHERKDTKAN